MPSAAPAQVAVPKYGDVVTDTQGRSGTAMFNPNTGAALSPAPTVMTDANIRESTIPSINQKTNALVSSGTPVGSLTTGTKTDTSSAATGTGTTTQPTTGQDSSSSSDYASLLKEYGLGGTDSASIESAVVNDPYITQATDLTTKLLASTDAQTSALVKSIKDQYDQKQTTLKQEQNAQNGALTQSLLLGNSFGAPVSTAGIQEAKNTYDLQGVNDLQNQENNLIQTALTAQKTGNYKALQDLNDQIEKVRQQKQDLASKVNQALIDQNAKVRTQKLQNTKDTAIANVLSSGITDPSKILAELNKSGSNFTLADVTTAMTNISKAQGLDTQGLSANVKDFFTLQQHHPEAIPAAISALPPNQQLGAWLQYMKAKTVSGVGKVNPITLSEAKAAGLPYSVIGQSQSEVEQSFNSEQAPAWFTEKLQGEQKQSLNPDYIQGQWDTYRKAYVDKFNNPDTTQEKTAAANDQVNQEKAKTYFSSEFDGLDDDTLNSLADSVTQYMNGGMTYAKAVAQVEADAGK